MPAGTIAKSGQSLFAINIADAYIGYAEFRLAKNEDPLPWIQKSDKPLSSIVEQNFPEIFLALSYAKRLEAEYHLRKKESPLTALQAAKKHLDRTFEINPAEYLIPLGKARLELINAEWLMLNQESPDEVLTNAEMWFRKILELNPKSSAAYEILAEVNLKKAGWKSRFGKDPQAEIQEGLSAIEKSLKFKTDLAEAYVVRANLLLLDSRSKSDPAACKGAMGESVKNFEHAFTINSFLQNKEQENFKRAKSAIQTGNCLPAILKRNTGFPIHKDFTASALHKTHNL